MEFLKEDVMRLSTIISIIKTSNAIKSHTKCYKSTHLMLYNHTPNGQKINVKCKNKLQILFKQYPNVCWLRVAALACYTSNETFIFVSQFKCA